MSFGESAQDKIGAEIARRYPKAFLPMEAAMTELRPDEQAAEDRAQAATGGRWENVRGIDGGIVCDIGDEAWDITEDAEFIAHARTDIPMFVERLEKAREQLEAVREWRDQSPSDRLFGELNEILKRSDLDRILRGEGE